MLRGAVFMILLALGPEGAGEPPSLTLPAAVGVWKAVAPDVTYTADTLHQYINGGAELYLSYGFVRLTSRRYARDDGGQTEITLDVFEMATPEDAFGVFTHGREGTPEETVPAGVAQDALLTGGLLTFWKGRYYVSILAYPDDGEATAALTTLARGVSAAIGAEGPRPALVQALPVEGLLPASVRLFRHPLWLSPYGLASSENVLDLASDCSVVVGRYRDPDGTTAVALVEYPSATRAERAATRFRRLVLGGEEGLRATPEGRWSGLARQGRDVAVVLDGPTEDAARRQLVRAREALARLPVSKEDPKP